MKRPKAVLSVCAMMLAMVAGLPAEARCRVEAAGDWPQQGYDPRRTSYNPHETMLGPGNVGELEILWSNSVPCTINTQPTVVDGVVYYGHYCGQFLAVDADTGATLWTQSIDTVDCGNAVVDGVVYVAARCTYSACGMVYAFDALTGETLWAWDAGYQQVLLPIVADGVVYVATKGVWGGMGTDSDAHGTQALDAATGEELWTAIQGGAAAVANGFVYATSSWHPDKLAVLDTANGDLLWTGIIGGDSVSRPTTDGQSVYVHADDGYLYAFDADGCGEAECEALWLGVVEIDPYGEPQPPAVAEGLVYVGAGDAFYAFDAAGCGEPQCPPLWATPTDCTFHANWHNSPSVANGVVYSTCDDNWIHAYDATSGHVLWSYYTSGGYPMRASPTVAGGRLYHAATFDFTLYAFEPLAPLRVHLPLVLRSH